MTWSVVKVVPPVLTVTVEAPVASAMVSALTATDSVGTASLSVIDTVAVDPEGVGLYGQSRGRLLDPPGRDVESGKVDGAFDDAAFEEPLVEPPHGMGTLRTEGVELAVDVRNGDFRVLDVYPDHLAGGDVTDFGDLEEISHACLFTALQRTAVLGRPLRRTIIPEGVRRTMGLPEETAALAARSGSIARATIYRRDGASPMTASRDVAQAVVVGKLMPRGRAGAGSAPRVGGGAGVLGLRLPIRGSGRCRDQRTAERVLSGCRASSMLIAARTAPPVNAYRVTV